MPKAENPPQPGGRRRRPQDPRGGSSSAASAPGGSEGRGGADGGDCKGHVRDARTLHPGSRPDLSQYPQIKREPGMTGGESPEPDDDAYSNGGGVETEADEEEERAMNMTMSGQRADSTSGAPSSAPSSMVACEELQMEKARLAATLAARPGGPGPRRAATTPPATPTPGRDGPSPSALPFDMMMMRRDDESPGPLHHHAGNPGTPGTPGPPGPTGPGEGSPGRRGGVPQYQQTLDAHMKEKHPESGGSCVYCRTGQPHPRLARGESYTCGYKPFRLRGLQLLDYNQGQPEHPHACQSRGQLWGPFPVQAQTEAHWRCEVCDYETNVARNLRIHMTSEKHMHNMMLLQQNMKQIQHSLHMGLAPAEAELYQYYLAQNMGLAGVKLENPASAGAPEAQMMMNPFQLDPGMAAALGSGLVSGNGAFSTTLSWLLGSPSLGLCWQPADRPVEPDLCQTRRGPGSAPSSCWGKHIIGSLSQLVNT
ncbi:unnamed protein product [Gadus morhua 'NCC']